MDYKYIEQLLERYWNCQTTLEEEQILRSFFNQEDIPVGLLKYKNLFCYEMQSKEVDKLDETFDGKILQYIDNSSKRTLKQRFMPLFKAAAIVCFLITTGTIIKNSMNYHEQHSAAATVAENKDTINTGTPSVAYENTVATDSAAIIDNWKN